MFVKTLVFFLNLHFQIYSKSKVTILAVTTSNPRYYSGEYPRLSRGSPGFDSVGVRFPSGECNILGKTLVFFLNLHFQIYSKSKVTI